MSKQYYFETWRDAEEFIEELDRLNVEFEVDGGVNVVDEGYDYLVTAEDGEWENDYGIAFTLGIIEEREQWRANYPREQYEADRAKLIAEGVNPRCVMSYSECMAYDLWQKELEREQEIWEGYDEAMLDDEERLRQQIADLEYELEYWDDMLYIADVADATEWEHFPEMERVMYALAERKLELREIERERAIAAEVAERDELIEFVELAEEAARSELAAFGCIEQRPQFDWNAKSTPDERGWARAALDIIAEYGADDTESVFELF